MGAKIFVNLPVKNLAASKAFYEALGFANNPQFTNADAACMVLDEHIYAMLLTHDFFKTFVSKPIADAHASTEVILALGLDGKAAVDAMTDAAVKAGGGETRPPQDMGFMYSRSIADLDGHIWEPFWMDPKHVQ